MTRRKAIIITAIILALAMITTAYGATFSEFWKQDSAGNWYVEKPDGSRVTNAWLCDDAVAENGKDVWYLLDAGGNMLTAGLVQDGTGNFYSLETEHNGYYGMLRYKSGNYGGMNLTLEGSHNGSFAAVLNPEGIEALKAQYGVTSCAHINNNNIVYTSSFGGSTGAAGGNGSAGSSGSSAAGSGVQQTTAGRYTEIGGPEFVQSTQKGTATLDNEEYQFLKSNAVDFRVYGYGRNNLGEPNIIYEWNQELLTLGDQSPAGNNKGQWIVDTSKPDAAYGKTNIRFRYEDGSYAGLGWHGCIDNSEEYRQLRIAQYRITRIKNNYFFTKDGYLIRNSVIYSYDNTRTDDVGQNGGWLDN